jgi:ribosome-binding protein aMBF1 (putative translation factor)
MNEEKKQKLEKAGWSVGSVGEFLELDPEESAIIELRLAFSQCIKNARLAAEMTQTVFATKLGTSQSRLNKIEAGDPSVGFDLFVKTFVRSGLDITPIKEALVGQKVGSPN